MLEADAHRRRGHLEPPGERVHVQTERPCLPPDERRRHEQFSGERIRFALEFPPRADTDLLGAAVARLDATLLELAYPVAELVRKGEAAATDALPCLAPVQPDLSVGGNEHPGHGKGIVLLNSQAEKVDRDRLNGDRKFGVLEMLEVPREDVCGPWIGVAGVLARCAHVLSSPASRTRLLRRRRPKEQFVHLVPLALGNGRCNRRTHSLAVRTERRGKGGRIPAARWRSPHRKR